jgi:hypothetical protein
LQGLDSVRPQDKGIKFTADRTRRGIALNNGYYRPHEILNILESGK